MSARDVERARAVAELGALPVPLGHAEPAESPQRTSFEARLEEYLGRPVVRRSCCGSERALAEIAVGLRDEVARLRAALDQAEDDRTGACLARWEEEQDNQRLRLAHKSAVARGVRLREQCATLAAQVAGVDRLLEDVQPWADAADRTAGLKAKPAGLSAEDWNERYPVGTRVHAYPGTRDDAPLKTRTRSVAWTLGHGAAVVMVEGHSAGIRLTHVDPEAGDLP
ncbi:hypothetical protein [Streptomyces sp. NPDC047315]|uniref:hypothetical protein n=1 Tax=Streptomyces sp. NPDC047315 TaxID=3155142 RepID=UPI0033EEF5D3